MIDARLAEIRRNRPANGTDYVVGIIKAEDSEAFAEVVRLGREWRERQNMLQEGDEIVETIVKNKSKISTGNDTPVSPIPSSQNTERRPIPKPTPLSEAEIESRLALARKPDEWIEKIGIEPPLLEAFEEAVRYGREWRDRENEESLREML